MSITCTSDRAGRTQRNYFERTARSGSPILDLFLVTLLLAATAPAAAQVMPFQQGSDGTVSMEMENFDASIEGSGASFALVTPSGAAGGQAMQAPGSGQPRLEYQVNFTQSGTHYVYVRALGTSGSSNSLWLGFNGDQFQYNVNIRPLNSWQWEGGFTINVPAPGEYTLSITRRESDAYGDKIVILTDAVTPTGTGPTENPRGGGDALPVVTITAPADGSSYTVGDTVDFSGTANDAEDGDLTASLSWTSNLDNTIGSGAGFSTSTLSAGVHTITASVSDSVPQQGTDSITITVQPLGGGTGAYQQAVDGTVSMEMENFDTSIENSGASFALVTPAGASGSQAMQAPGNGQPVLEYQVNFIQGGTHFVFLRGQGLSGGSNSFWLGFNGDQFQYNVSIGPLNSWQWEGGYAINVPAPGEYTLTMTRRETNTLGDKIVILTSNVSPTGNGPTESTRSGGDALPVVTITAPADGSSFTVGDTVNFSGTANDAEDGDLTASLSWTSNLDGTIGSGASFATSTLNAGTHTITAAVTDSAAQTVNASIGIIVQVSGGTVAGLPFTEPFDDTNLRDATNTSADWNTTLSLLTTGFAEPLQNTFGAASAAITIGTTIETDHAAALEDLDGDGDADLVLVGNSTDRYYLNDGSTTPFSPATVTFPLQDSASASRAVVVEDFDQDGHVDILVTKNGTTFANQIYYGNGTSNPFNGVTPADLGTTPASSGSAHVGDIDGDGDPDIVIGNTNTADEYFLNLGNRLFSAGVAIPVPLDTETKAIRLGDMDLDGRLDLVVATTLDPVLFEGELRLDVATGVDEGTFLYLNNGSVTPFTGVVPTRISDDENKLPSNGTMDLGDVNGDGYLDVLIGNLTVDRIYLNNTSGPGIDPFLGVSGSSVSADLRNTQSAVLADIDNDGDLDYLAGNKPRSHGSAADNVGTDRLYLNDGSGVFAAGIDVTGDTVGDSQAVAVAELSGDDQADILIADLAGLSRYIPNGGSGSGLPDARQLNSQAQSQRIDNESDPIAGVLLTAFDTVPSYTRIRYWLSNNGGLTWIRAYPGIESNFATIGNELRWRADLNSRSPAGFPSVDALSVILTSSGSGGGSGAFQQAGDGTVSMEMENFDTSIENSGASFALVTPAGASGSQSMQAPGNGQPVLEYQVNFVQSGTHFVFLRGQGLSGGANSFWLGFNGDQFQYNVSIGPLNSWQWEGGYAINVPAPGEYTLTITRRETDTLGDKIVILTSNLAPTGDGPTESIRNP